jgi:hypothetical protein
MGHPRLLPLSLICLLIVFCGKVSSAPSRTGTFVSQVPLALEVPRAKFGTALASNTNEYYPTTIAIGDLNGDGTTDLVVGDSGGGFVSVLLGNGDGTFQPGVVYGSGGSGYDSVAIGDVNGDGKPDVAVTNESSNSVAVLLGNGDGTFEGPVAYDSGGFEPNSVVIADVNKDGKQDLIVATRCQSSSDCSDGSVSVLLGNGDGTFQAAVSYSSGGATSGPVVIGDLRGDGKQDLVVANYGSDSVGVLLGNGDGTFNPAATYSTGSYQDFWEADSIAIGDVNGDGYADLAVATGGGLYVLLGNGDGTFQPAVAYMNTCCAVSVAIADVNGDGHLDLVTSEQRVQDHGLVADVAVLLGNGDGTFQKPAIHKTGGSWPCSIAVGDVNRDGRPDLIVPDCNSDSIEVQLNLTTSGTKIEVAASPNPSVTNELVTVTATMSSADIIPPGQTITFYSGADEIGTGTTINGVAQISTSFSKARTYTIKAEYKGSGFLKASSGWVKQVVDP